MTSLPPAVIHIPHALTAVPENIRPTICLTDDELEHELLIMTDWFTDDLFAVPNDTAMTVRFPVSRLVVDPERFVDDDSEPMASKGMGVIYNKTSDGRDFRHGISTENRDLLLKTYYYPHQQAVQDAVAYALAAHDKCLLIDAHSFPSKPLPHEPDQSPNRCNICIGTDEFHTPTWLVTFLLAAFEKRGFTVAINQPFSGTFVPTSYYHVNPSILSVMIEINRSLYMDELTGDRHSGFNQFRSNLQAVLTETIGAFIFGIER